MKREQWLCSLQLSDAVVELENSLAIGEECTSEYWATISAHLAGMMLESEVKKTAVVPAFLYALVPLSTVVLAVASYFTF